MKKFSEKSLKDLLEAFLNECLRKYLTVWSNIPGEIPPMVSARAHEKMTVFLKDNECNNARTSAAILEGIFKIISEGIPGEIYEGNSAETSRGEFQDASFEKSLEKVPK